MALFGPLLRTHVDLMANVSAGEEVCEEGFSEAQLTACFTETGGFLAAQDREMSIGSPTNQIVR